MTPPPIRTVSEFLQAAKPAFREILTADEFAATTIHSPDGAFQPAIDPWPTQPEAGDALLDEDTIVSISTLGNTIRIWAGGGRDTPTEAYERVRNGLQDFVAESTFGWGQLRP